VDLCDQSLEIADETGETVLSINLSGAPHALISTTAGRAARRSPSAAIRRA
jgi:hypothetical protein